MVRYFLIFFFWCLLVSQVFGQINFNVSLSQKHLQKVEKAKDVKTKLKRYKKLYKRDSVRLSKEVRDSLKQAGVERLGEQVELPGHLPDSASTRDSLQWALNTLAAYNQNEAVEDFYKNVSSLDSSTISNLDSLVLVPAAQKIAEKYMPDDPGLQGGDINSLQQEHLKGLPIGPSKDPMGQIQGGPAGLKGNAAARVTQLAQKVNTDQLAKLQTNLEKLKKKYVSMPDLSKPDEGVKRNSLKGQPLKKRIYLGGNVSVQSTDPIVLDSDVRVGYKLTKKLSTGVGVRWRESFFHKDDSLMSLSKHSHGYNGFVSYDIHEGFFLYGEYAAMRNKALFSEVKASVRWQYEYLLGVGRSFEIGKFAELSMTFLYDFNHRKNDLHPRPFVFRFGYKIKGFPFGKKK